MSYREYQIHPFNARGPGFFAHLPPVTAWLLKVNLAVYAVFWLLRLDGLYDLFALSFDGIRRHYYWQPITYMFLHGGFTHLLFNMFTLYFLGPETERSMGSRHFLALYLLSGLLGGLGWIWLSPHPYAACVGASGAIFGILAAFATLYPRRRLTLLIFFIFPVTLQAATISPSDRMCRARHPLLPTRPRSTASSTKSPPKASNPSPRPSAKPSTGPQDRSNRFAGNLIKKIDPLNKWDIVL